MENSKLTIFKKIKTFIVSHKKLSILILVILVALSSYLIFRNKNNVETKYVTAVVEKGTIISSVTGTGQIETSNSIDLKAKVSSDIIYIGVKAGDVVKKGKLLVSLDSKTAQKSVRDAEISLETTKLSLEKSNIENSEENLNADLAKSYEDGFNNVSDTFLDLPTIITGLDDLLGENNLSDNTARLSGRIAQDYRDNAEELYYKARKAFYTNRSSYRILTRDSSKEEIEDIIDETYETTKLVSDAVKSIRNFVDYLADDTDQVSSYTSFQDTLSEYTSTTNNNLSNLLSSQTEIKDNKDAFTSNDLDSQSNLLSLLSKENSLQDAKDTLADYYVYAPFDGTISSITAKVGDTASGTLATIITKQKIATISLNEVDIAKIKLGQKTTLTFDAIDTLIITGEVSEIDSIGTVSQGVVSYNVKISFDVSDDMVKPGMSVSASIITNIAQDILIVPNSAVKNQNGISYVQTFDAPFASLSTGLKGSLSETLPKQTKVIVGLIDDTNTEITSGLKEGDIVVTKTITGTTTTTKSTAPSLINAVSGSKTTTSGSRMGGGAGMAFPHD